MPVALLSIGAFRRACQSSKHHFDGTTTHAIGFVELRPLENRPNLHFRVSLALPDFNTLR